MVSAVSSGEDALESWRAEEPDVVLLDVSMPSMAGTQVCQTIRTTSSTPVVLLSGTHREADIVRGFEAGADDYLTKPLSFNSTRVRSSEATD